MMEKQFSDISCGVHLLSGLHGTLDEQLKFILQGNVTYMGEKFREPRKRAFFVFSDGDIYQNGIRLAASIENEKLGYIMETEKRRNPNSGHDIRVWVWAPDMDAIRDYLSRIPGMLDAKTDMKDAKQPKVRMVEHVQEAEAVPVPPARSWELRNPF